MTFEVSGGIEWEKDEGNKKLTIRPTATPEEGSECSPGQMKGYDTIGPWNEITETGWTVEITGEVKNIGVKSFSGCSGITTLSVPPEIQEIGDYAFENCSGLTSLTLPTNAAIRDSAFYGCTGLTGKITIPDGVRDIGQYAFSGCGGTGFEVSDKNENFSTIMGGVLANKDGSTIIQALTGMTGDITIPDNVSAINAMAFYGCNGLTGSLVIPLNAAVGDDAFYNCSGFTGTLTLPNAGIGRGAFYGCSGFTGSLTISGKTKSIGDEAFYGCMNFNEIVFEGKPAIGDDAFCLNTKEPAKNYTVHSDGWAKEETFPAYTYTLWIYVDHQKYVTKSGLTKYTEIVKGKLDEKQNTSTLDDDVSNLGYIKDAIIGVSMNGSDVTIEDGKAILGTVITAHQDISGKQNVLTTAQLGACNSGITSTKVGTYDGYATTIAGKLDKPTSTITAGTSCKITYDTNGLITAGAGLEAGDIPALASNKITKMTGYAKASAVSEISEDDQLNAAIGKLDYRIGTKVDKVDGYGLSKNDFTDTLLGKLNGIAEGATKITVDSALGTSTNPVQNTVINTAITDINNSIGSEATANTILYRIKQLETKVSELESKVSELQSGEIKAKDVTS